MATDKSFDLSTILTVAAIGVGVVVLLKIVLAQSRPVQPQTNALVAAIDAVPGILNAVGGLFRGSSGGGSEIDSGYVDQINAEFG